MLHLYHGDRKLYFDYMMTHILDRILTWLDTGTLMKRGGDKLPL
jgi:hypothetical protein